MFCHAEVSQRDVPIVVKDNVAGFDVPVHDVHIVHLLDSKHLKRDKELTTVDAWHESPYQFRHVKPGTITFKCPASHKFKGEITAGIEGLTDYCQHTIIEKRGMSVPWPDRNCSRRAN
jgi:hypothetical protein